MKSPEFYANVYQITKVKFQVTNNKICRCACVGGRRFYDAFPDVDALYFTVEYVSEYNAEAETQVDADVYICRRRSELSQ